MKPKRTKAPKTSDSAALHPAALDPIEAAVHPLHPSAKEELAGHASPLALTRSETMPVSDLSTAAAPASKPARRGRARPGLAAALLAGSRTRQSEGEAGSPSAAVEAARADRSEHGGGPVPFSGSNAPPAPSKAPAQAGNDNARPPVAAAGVPAQTAEATDASGRHQAKTASQPGAGLQASEDPGPGQVGELLQPVPEFEALARTMGRLIENSGKVMAAYLTPLGTGVVRPPSGDEIVQTMNSLGRVAESWLHNPTRMIQAQTALSTQLFALWNSSLSLHADGGTEPGKVADKRFAAPEWRESPFFDFLHRAYLLTTDWAKAMVADAEGVDQATRDKAAFYLRQISSALSPSNFIATNPELLRETFQAKGENLARGMEMLAEDIAAGGGELKIRQSDASKFTLGVDMAATPGAVVFRNDLMELIQYAPSTETVLRRPLLIVPPWINKFYVLDLNRDKSFIAWAVAQGLTVFIISWVNPDKRHARKDWDAYMTEGIFAALDAVEQAVGEREVSTVGYCVGGTLLAATLAFMAAKGDGRVTASTFLTTQVDFEDAGDLKVFADEAQIQAIERQMHESGYLAGSRMANAFNMLRPDDLIWSYSVNAYLKGKAPKPFDLLTWNADSTRMSAANHAFYLRNCYLENNLTRGEMVMGGEKLNLGAVTIPIYDLAAKEDHIAPARSVFNGAKSFGGPVRYVMAGSGHIAGVVNPPSKAKYQYWTDGRPDGSFEDWIASAKETPGTWWLDWIAWLKQQAPDTVPARTPGEGNLAPICAAPGEYVRVQS